MPIFVWVNAGVSSCRACAEALKKLAEGITTAGRNFTEADSRSHREWGKGEGGENFRTSLASVHVLADRISQVSESVSTAVDNFASDIMTVNANMNAAVNVAVGANLEIIFAGSYPEWIGDPKPRIEGPLDASGEANFQVQQAKQVDTYNQALEIVSEARKLEESAHAKLRQETNGNTSVLVGVIGELEKQAPWLWMGAQSVVGTIGEAVKRYDVWTDIAQTRVANVSAYRSMALETVGDSYRTAAINSMLKFSGSVGHAESVVAFNAKLAGGNPDGQLARGLARNIIDSADDSKLTPSIAKFGEKLPIAGGLLAGVQTGYEIWHGAEDSGDAARIVARNTGGYVAGATVSAILAGTFSAPVLVVVGGGLLASFGATWVINTVLD